MKKLSTYNITKILVFLLLVVNVFLPVISLMREIRVEDIEMMFANSGFLTMISNSFLATSISTILSVVFAFLLAWCVNRSNIRYKNVITILFTIPMLIPSISHGMGLVLLLGDNGILTNIFGIHLDLYGLVGIVMGSVLYSFPVAFIMFCDALKYEDYTIYEAAEVMGMNKWQQFKQITLHNLKGTLFSVIFATFTMIFSDYGVPLVVGGKFMTIPVYMYQEVIGLMDFSKGAILSVLLLIPAFIAFIVDLKRNNVSASSTTTKAYAVKKNKQRDIVCSIICGVVFCLILLPILSFVVLSFVTKFPIDMQFTLNNLLKAAEQDVFQYLFNSITIALGTSLIGIIIIYYAAYISSRSSNGILKNLIHFLSIITLSIPGIVLGLCFVLFFNGTMVYGTVFILIIVNVVHFFASPYLMAYNSLNSFAKSYEDVASVMGIGKMRMLFDVYIPSTKATIVEMYSYLFVNSMVTISAVSFLASVRNMPLALLIPQFDSQSMIEISALISIIILMVNIVMKMIVYFVKRAITMERI